MTPSVASVTAFAILSSIENIGFGVVPSWTDGGLLFGMLVSIMLLDSGMLHILILVIQIQTFDLIWL